MEVFNDLIWTLLKYMDVAEAIKVNFDGCLNDSNVDKHSPSRYILVEKVTDKVYEIENLGKMCRCTYNVFVKNNEEATGVIENWKQANNFDDLAFDNAERGKKQVKIGEVRRVL